MREIGDEIGPKGCDLMSMCSLGWSWNDMTYQWSMVATLWYFVLAAKSRHVCLSKSVAGGATKSRRSEYEIERHNKATSIHPCTYSRCKAVPPSVGSKASYNWWLMLVVGCVGRNTLTLLLSPQRHTSIHPFSSIDVSHSVCYPLPIEFQFWVKVNFSFFSPPPRNCWGINSKHE